MLFLWVPFGFVSLCTLAASAAALPPSPVSLLRPQVLHGIACRCQMSLWPVLSKIGSLLINMFPWHCMLSIRLIFIVPCLLIGWRHTCTCV